MDYLPHHSIDPGVVLEHSDSTSSEHQNYPPGTKFKHDPGLHSLENFGTGLDGSKAYEIHGDLQNDERYHKFHYNDNKSLWSNKYDNLGNLGNDVDIDDNKNGEFRNNKDTSAIGLHFDRNFNSDRTSYEAQANKIHGTSPPIFDNTTRLYPQEMIPSPESGKLYGPFLPVFKNIEEARKWSSRMRRRPYWEDDLSEIIGREGEWIKRIYESMLSKDDVNDGENSVAYRRFGIDRHYCEEDLIAAAWVVVYDCLDLYRYGFCLPDDFDYTKTSKEDKNLSCVERLEAICKTLKHEKSVCRDLMDGMKIKVFVNAPLGFCKRKDCNRRGNISKRMRLDRDKATQSFLKQQIQKRRGLDTEGIPGQAVVILTQDEFEPGISVGVREDARLGPMPEDRPNQPVKPAWRLFGGSKSLEALYTDPTVTEELSAISERTSTPAKCVPRKRAAENPPSTPMQRGMSASSTGSSRGPIQTPSFLMDSSSQAGPIQMPTPDSASGHQRHDLAGVLGGVTEPGVVSGIGIGRVDEALDMRERFSELAPGEIVYPSGMGAVGARTGPRGTSYDLLSIDPRTFQSSPPSVGPVSGLHLCVNPVQGHHVAGTVSRTSPPPPYFGYPPINSVPASSVSPAPFKFQVGQSMFLYRHPQGESGPGHEHGDDHRQGQGVGHGFRADQNELGGHSGCDEREL